VIFPVARVAGAVAVADMCKSLSGLEQGDGATLAPTPRDADCTNPTLNGNGLQSAVIKVIKSADRHFADHGWLKTHWHFSFSDYHDPANMGFSKLRVFNDDIVKGGGGFDLHPHRDMEIITYVLEGELAHKDNLGNAGVVHPGEVQVMSAGTGIRHAEFNNSDTDDVHLLQIWIEPRHKGNTPRWEQRQFTAAQRAGKLLPVVSGGDVDGTLAIDQDAMIYVSSLKTGESATHAIKAGHRHIYLFVMCGQLIMNDQKISAGDQARIEDEAILKLVAIDDSELILLDLP
jgi:redox-sensitive bicupin YhaK (pirin superfamily)